MVARVYEYYEIDFTQFGSILLHNLLMHFTSNVLRVITLPQAVHGEPLAAIRVGAISTSRDIVMMETKRCSRKACEYQNY